VAYRIIILCNVKVYFIKNGLWTNPFLLLIVSLKFYFFTPHPVEPYSSSASLGEAGRAEQGCKGASRYYLKESPVFQHGVQGLLL
jgi:hypothetical protein